MKQIENSGLFVDLNSEEMVDLNGGGVIVEKILYYAGVMFGALARAQELHGDSGQWMQ